MKIYVGSKIGDYDIDGYVWFIGRRDFETLEAAIEFVKLQLRYSNFEYTKDLDDVPIISTLDIEDFTNQPGEYPTVLVAKGNNKQTVVIGVEYN